MIQEIEGIIALFGFYIKNTNQNTIIGVGFGKNMQIKIDFRRLYAYNNNIIKILFYKHLWSE